MASNCNRVQQDARNNVMEMMAKAGPGGMPNGKTSDLFCLASSSSQTGNGTTEKTDLKCHSPNSAIAHKIQDPVYPNHSTATLAPKIEKNRSSQSIGCWQDSSSFIYNKESSVVKLCFALVLLVSLTSLVVVTLDVMGIIGPSCACNGNLVKTRYQDKENLQTNESTLCLLNKIDALEKNVSSLVNSSTIRFRKITAEVQQLRENQVQFDSSLNDLKKSDKTRTTDIQEMSAKVVGLAVAVSFLGTNDSLIKSKVHDLSTAQINFMKSLESLKRKDAALDTALERAKYVGASLNSSVNQLKSVNGQLKTKMDLLNTTFMAKIINMTGMIQGRPGLPGPPGPQGPRGIPGTPGAGNLSQCYHKQNKLEGQSSSSADYSVFFFVPKDKVVVGATCSTIRGDETNLSSGTNSRGETVYSCQCKGQSHVHKDLGSIKCIIDVWVCPEIS